MKLKEYKYKINGTKFTVGVGDITDNTVHVEVNGVPYEVEIDKEAKTVSVPGNMKRPAAAPRTETGEKVIATPEVSNGGASAVKSPLPGTITTISVKAGDQVKTGDTVCVLEAMKMENSINAGRDGVVASINVNPGDAVPDGGVIITLE